MAVFHIAQHQPSYLGTIPWLFHHVGLAGKETTPGLAEAVQISGHRSRFRPAGGMRTIHRFSGDRLTPPVVL